MSITRRKKNGRYEIDFSIGHASTLMPMQLISHKYPIEFFNSPRKHFKYKVEVTKASNVWKLKITTEFMGKTVSFHFYADFSLSRYFFLVSLPFPIELFYEPIDCFDFVARNFVANQMVCKPFSNNNIEMRISVFGHDRLVVQCLGT